MEQITIKKTTKEKEILEEAQKLFSHFGLKKTSLEDIASSLGMAKTSLYYYFKSKSELFKAVLKHESSSFIKNIKKIFESSNDIKEILTTYFKKRTEYAKELSKLRGLIAKAQKSPFISGEETLLTNLLEQGVKDEILKKINPELLAVLILSLLKGLEKNLPLIRKREIEERDYDLFIDVLFNGILKK
ncbi:TetR/AcrR family transcriptional regulator [bacterium]|nr:TetR/AcrR family transcriptional regulator [bacterium]